MKNWTESRKRVQFVFIFYILLLSAFESERKKLPTFFLFLSFSFSLSSSVHLSCPFLHFKSKRLIKRISDRLFFLLKSSSSPKCVFHFICIEGNHRTYSNRFDTKRSKWRKKGEQINVKKISTKCFRFVFCILPNRTQSTWKRHIEQ